MGHTGNFPLLWYMGIFSLLLNNSSIPITDIAINNEFVVVIFVDTPKEGGWDKEVWVLSVLSLGEIGLRRCCWYTYSYLFPQISSCTVSLLDPRVCHSNLPQ